MKKALFAGLLFVGGYVYAEIVFTKDAEGNIFVAEKVLPDDQNALLQTYLNKAAAIDGRLNDLEQEKLSLLAERLEWQKKADDLTAAIAAEAK